MAILTVNVPNADVPDALAAIEQVWAGDAARLYFADRASYDAAPAAQRAKACVGAWLAVTTKNYRTTKNQVTAPAGTEPVIT